MAGKFSDDVYPSGAKGICLKCGAEVFGPGPCPECKAAQDETACIDIILGAVAHSEAD